MRILLASGLLLAACTEHGTSPPGGGSAGTDGGVSQVGCPNGHREKIMFAQATSCANDGSVEFCIPDGESALAATLAEISPTIRCAPGGGRAMCAAQPGLLLCTYPTSFPAECAAPGGAMTEPTWLDMCDIAALPEVVQIVPTFVE
jgi:hypothetical protein